MNKALLRKCVAEYIGTFMIVLGGCGAIATNDLTNGAVSHLGIAIAFGLSVLTMIYALGHISGAHFNPAVTLAFALKRHFPKKQILPYWIFQFLGALSASAILWFTLRKPDGSPVAMGVTLPYNNLFLTAFVWEIILTTILMIVIMAIATDYRAVGASAGLTIGGTVGLEALFAGPICNASMNPFRSIAPAIIEGNFTHLIAFIAGPIIGAILGAFIYDFMRCETKKCDDVKGCC